MKNQLSYTAIEKYKTCPKMYFQHYIRGIREKYVGSPLIFGGAFDEGLNVLLSPGHPLDYSPLDRAKVKFLVEMKSNKLNGVDTKLETTDLVAYSNTDFDVDILTDDDLEIIKIEFKEDDLTLDYLKKVHEDLVNLKRTNQLKGVDLREFNFLSWISLQRKGLLFLEAYDKQIIPLIKRVIVVQKEFEIVNDDGDKFKGLIDLVAELHDGRIVVFDNKTSASRYKEDQARTSRQLAGYFGVLQELGFFEEHKIDLDKLHIGYLVIVKKIRKKKEPRVDIQVIIDKVDPDLIDAVFEEYDVVNQKIHSGEFPANPENCKSLNFGKCFCKLNKDQLVDVSDTWKGRR